MTQTVTARPAQRDPRDAPPRVAVHRPWGSRRWLVSGLALIGAVGVWALAAVIVNDPILPNPADVADRVLAIIVSGEAVTNFAASIGKIAAGFAIAMVAGSGYRIRHGPLKIHDVLLLAAAVRAGQHARA
ncbi:MAG: hypothetical protein U5N53_12815 [Mycobacterium sp.]|nr:hypothetical protein [Mycobacterium sp.]